MSDAHKTGFKKALLGLSGGIDSALTAVIAAEALGPQNVIGVSLPSVISSQHSRDDAAAVAKNLGIAYQIYDDVVDLFGVEQQIGKTLGTDLASGKLTLPLMLLLERLAPAAQRFGLVIAVYDVEVIRGERF